MHRRGGQFFSRPTLRSPAHRRHTIQLPKTYKFSAARRNEQLNDKCSDLYCHRYGVRYCDVENLAHQLSGEIIEMVGSRHAIQQQHADHNQQGTHVANSSTAAAPRDDAVQVTMSNRELPSWRRTADA